MKRHEWQLATRRRELEQGKAPREVTFCIDEAEQAEYRRRWLEGDEIADIRRDIERRKEAAKAVATTATEAQDESETPQTDWWASPAFDDTRPSYE